MYIASRITRALDLAVLSPTARDGDIFDACERGKAYNVRTVCVPPIYVQKAVATGVPVSTVIGFPHGNSTPEQKCTEAIAMMDKGAVELDVVINYGRILDGDGRAVVKELTGILKEARPRGCVVKAILESCVYPPIPLFDAANLCARIGVDYVKTSTGYGGPGATTTAVKIMLDAVKGTATQVKASGGIKCHSDAVKYLDLGCTRLGSSCLKELLP